MIGEIVVRVITWLAPEPFAPIEKQATLEEFEKTDDTAENGGTDR